LPSLGLGRGDRGWPSSPPELTFFCNDAYRRDTLGEQQRPTIEDGKSVWCVVTSDV